MRIRSACCLACSKLRTKKEIPRGSSERGALLLHKEVLQMRPWALQALSVVAWVQSASPGEHPQSVTDCNDVACVAASLLYSLFTL